MKTLKSVVTANLYKLAMRLKPILVKVIPFKVRQAVKLKMLKAAYPLDENRKKSHNEPLAGVNLIGYARAEMGIGESCRIAANSFSSTSIPFGIINYTGTNTARMNDMTWVHKEMSEPKYNVNIFHINAEQMIEVYANHGNKLFNNRYNIGYWHWELPDFPDEWVESFKLVDEIWVPSTFVADAISIKSPVPVVKVPHSIEINISEQRNRQYLKLPEEAFLFLTMYDLKSYQARKNPRASIEAFKKAFHPNDHGVGLIIKANTPSPESKELVELKKIIGEYENIHLICETYSRNDTYALIASSDSYLSLHRSEGFGLGLAEAMYLGKPVVGTNWSSNVDFMNKDNSCLVDYELVPLDQDHGPYKKYQYWAEPNVEHAAELMSKLYYDRNFYALISSNGERDIKRHYSPQKIGEIIKKRLDYVSQWNFGG